MENSDRIPYSERIMMSKQRKIILVAHNLRSSHNVGSLLRTAEGLGIEKVFLTGYTPYPLMTSDSRLPYLARKIDAKIHKTALGAEAMPWEHSDDIVTTLMNLRDSGYSLVALEQAESASLLPAFRPSQQIALIVGREVEGLEATVLAQMDTIVEIPMFGQKESFNVVQAAAMAMYHCRFQ